MLKTERLYYHDSYLREFEARVIDIASDAKGFRVYLDRTAFYPESGGQPADAGTLDGVQILDVVDEGSAIAHILPGKPAGEMVCGQIGWARRFDHMQQHTGQHVLSAAFERSGGYKTVSFHMGREVSTIDLDSDRLGRRQIEEAEDLANHVVFENREVCTSFHSAEDARSRGLRKPSDREGEVRLVEVKDFDLSACGGTHVGRTGEIGPIAARKLERMKGLTRVEFVCGARALGAARKDYLLLSEAAHEFSSPAEKVPTLIRKQSAELGDLLQKAEKLHARLAEHRTRELLAVAPERHGRRIVRVIFSSADLEDPKSVAHTVVSQTNAIALVGMKGSPAGLIFVQSSGGPDDMSAILHEVIARFGGKGGGRRDFAQAGGIREEKLDEALKFAESLLKP